MFAHLTLSELWNLAAGGGTLAGSGFAIWHILLWLTNRFDKRQAQLDAEHSALDMSWKDYRLFLERDRREMRAEFDTLKNQNRAMRLAFEHVSGALIRIDPHNGALNLAERILRQAFGADFTVLAGQAEAAIDAVGKDRG